jgi:hypothetical protein
MAYPACASFGVADGLAVVAIPGLALLASARTSPSSRSSGPTPAVTWLVRAVVGVGLGASAIWQFAIVEDVPGGRRRRVEGGSRPAGGGLQTARRARHDSSHTGRTRG